MIRYLRLYAHFLRFSFSKALEFRVDFYFRIFMDLAYYATDLFFFKVIYLHSKFLAGWSESQTMIFVSGFLVVDALQMTIFANNAWGIAPLVNRGDLDYYLVRPVSTLFFVSLRDFAANSFINLIMAISIVFWAFSKYPDPISPVSIVLFGLLLLNGAILYYLVLLLFIIPVFWTHSNRGLQPLFWTASKFLERPHRIYSAGLRLVLTTILPFSLMASMPATVLFENNPWPLTLGTLALSGLFFSVVASIWRLGLRNYSSASS